MPVCLVLADRASSRKRCAQVGHPSDVDKRISLSPSGIVSSMFGDRILWSTWPLPVHLVMLSRASPLVDEIESVVFNEFSRSSKRDHCDSHEVFQRNCVIEMGFRGFPSKLVISNRVVVDKIGVSSPPRR